MLPSYISYLGAESLGLLGFFLMLSGWLQFLDMGMSPAFSRQCSLFKAGALSLIEVRRLLCTLELFFGALAGLIIFMGFTFSFWLAENWLRPVSLSQSTVAWSIVIMACLVGFRWLSALYRSGLVGLEKQGDVNFITAISATIKFVFVIPYFIFVSSEILSYFQYQLVAGVLELLLYRRSLRTVALPKCFLSALPTIHILKGVLPFASGVAFTSAISIALTNVDKLILSRILDLKEYGYFSLAVIVAGGLLYFISPVTQIFQPRFSRLVAKNQHLELQDGFGELTQFVCSLMSGLGFSVALFAEPVLLMWTGSQEVAQHAAPTLFWYVLGNAVIGILTLPYILQFAYGVLRLHVFGMTALAILLIPLTVWSAISYGAVGAGRVWFFANLLFLFLWIPMVFKYYGFGSYSRWLAKDVIVPSVATAIPLLMLSNLNSFELVGLHFIISLMVVCVIGILFGVLAGEGSRKRVIGLLANGL
jgi:O-antigen/teichoic acid export membrane protein